MTQHHDVIYFYCGIIVSEGVCCGYKWTDQFQIKDFPEVGAPTLQGEGAPTYDCAKFSPRIAWNWNNLDRQVRGASLMTPSPLDE